MLFASFPCVMRLSESFSLNSLTPSVGSPPEPFQLGHMPSLFQRAFILSLISNPSPNSQNHPPLFLIPLPLSEILKRTFSPYFSISEDANPVFQLPLGFFLPGSP